MIYLVSVREGSGFLAGGETPRNTACAVAVGVFFVSISSRR